jgi:glycosyltransferase involved in cell wall biosynthesis
LFSCIPRMLGTKTAVTVQGLDWQRRKWGHVASTVLRLGERASLNFPDATMVVSQALRARYEEPTGARVFYVPNGGLLRDRREPQAIRDWGIHAGRYILFLGRFSPEKGCHLLVDAFERLHTDVQLVMAGPSSYCDEYSRELRKHASDRLRILDWVSGETLDELLTNAMIFVLPSELEGLSLALLDAMGAGLCVVTSDIPENREVVDGAGFTFKCADAADLAERLNFLIANPAVREAAGKAAQRRIRERYAWDKIAADIEDIYFDILGWPRPRAAKKAAGSVRLAPESAASERQAG